MLHPPGNVGWHGGQNTIHVTGIPEVAGVSNMIHIGQARSRRCIFTGSNPLVREKKNAFPGSKDVVLYATEENLGLFLPIHRKKRTSCK